MKKSRISLGATNKQQDMAMGRLKSRYRDGAYARLAGAIIHGPAGGRRVKSDGSGGLQVDPDPTRLPNRWLEPLKPGDLDKSVQQLPYLYYEVSDALANAINDVRDRKDRYEEVYAQTEQNAWENPSGEARMTVARAKSIAESSKAVRNALVLLRRAEAAVNKLEALKQSYDKKASMLKAEVELVASQFIQRDHVKPRTRPYKFSETKDGSQQE